MYQVLGGTTSNSRALSIRNHGSDGRLTTPASTLVDSSSPLANQPAMNEYQDLLATLTMKFFCFTNQALWVSSCMFGSASSKSKRRTSSGTILEISSRLMFFPMQVRDPLPNYVGIAMVSSCFFPGVVCASEMSGWQR